MKKIIPPIARLGGKSKLRKQIIELFPNYECYCEPFFGAGWVYFAKELSKVEIINDRDRNLINLFRILKYHSEEMERLLKYEVHSRDKFKYYRETKVETDVQKAVQFFYLVNNSFASKGTTYGYAPSKLPKQKNTMSFSEIKERLKNTYIENSDFQDLIKRYDRKYTLFFCDPPYLETSGYEVKFEKGDHIRLYETLNSIQGTFLLTINDHPFIKKLYHNYNIIEIETLYTANKTNNKKVTELIIRNY